MKSGKIIYFKLKFWPDKENRKIPEDNDIDFDNLNVYALLRYRNEMRLYYRNWVAVWRTYKYFTRFIPLLLPITWLFSTYWIASSIILLFWGIC